MLKRMVFFYPIEDIIKYEICSEFSKMFVWCRLKHSLIGIVWIKMSSSNGQTSKLVLKCFFIECKSISLWKMWTIPRYMSKIWKVGAKHNLNY